MKRKTAFMVMLLLAACSFAQTTVTFKPNADVGKDARIFMFNDNSIPNNNCAGWNHTTTPRYLNYGDDPAMTAVCWTWGSCGCGMGTARSLIAFEELSTIPVYATVLSAKLTLYGVPNGMNSLYSSSVAEANTTNNSSKLFRITSSWEESSVTWDNQPTTTDVNVINIQSSTSEYNWNFTDSSSNLVAMIQDIVANPSSNNGFMLKLQTENTYRTLVFASSDYPDSTLHPELVITYFLPVCNSNFSYNVNVEYPTVYTFTAESHNNDEWKVNDVFVSSDSTFTYNFEEVGTYKVCHKQTILSGDTCSKCTFICVSDGQSGNDLQEISVSTQQVVSVFPNPTTQDWNINIPLTQSDNIEIVVSDINGNKVYSQTNKCLSGDNNIILKGNNLLNGVYILHIKGQTINYIQKISKLY
ncbi:MAG: DNRLRE domain-containing protein [Bacteroidales bacterium]|jgi:hypothetical protein|nr:DNRLRE domain-containing protein [Bacteroidales bacterium]